MKLIAMFRYFLQFFSLFLLLKCLLNTFEGINKQFDDHQQFNTKKSLFMKSLHSKMNNRKSLIENSCQTNKNHLLNLYSKLLKMETNWNKISESIIYTRPEYLIDRKHNIGWCKVPKAGSASMVQTLLKLHNLHQSNRSNLWGHSLLAKQMPPPSKHDNLAGVISFILVRHPFSRILSAFRDKFKIRNITAQFRRFKKYGGMIIAKYRKDTPMEEKYLDMPTFEEFIKHIVDTSPLKYNEHWIPYYLSCVPCQIKFESILHTETLADDLEHLVEITGIKELRMEHVHHNVAKTDEMKYAGKVSVDVDELYYSTISKNLLQLLFEIYRIDFEMFGYSIHPYDHYAKEA